MADKGSFETNLAHHAHHWRYVRRRRARAKSQNAREIFMAQLITLTGSIIAGYILDVSKLHLAGVVGVFLILPGVFDLGGSIAGAMGARIGHRLEEGHEPGKVMHDSLMHAYALVAVASVFLAFFGATLATVLFGAVFWRIFVITIAATLLASAIGMPIVAHAAYRIFKRGADTDNIIGPLDTSLFDALSIIMVTFVVVMLS